MMQNLQKRRNRLIDTCTDVKFARNAERKRRCLNENDQYNCIKCVINEDESNQIIYFVIRFLLYGIEMIWREEEEERNPETWRERMK